MKIKTVTRHCDVPDFVLERANRKIARLSRFEPRLTSAEVVFHVERHVHRVDAILSLKGEGPAVARGEADDFAAALDRAADRLSKILRRRHARLTMHRGSR